MDIPFPPDRKEFIIIPHENPEVELKNGIRLKSFCRALTITGNTIFNWPICPPMKWGIEEDASCEKNIISLNNIDYVQEGGVSSKGKGSIARDNLEHKDRPYWAPASDKWQSYDRRQLEQYIRGLNP
jgi:hypothetical protein